MGWDARAGTQPRGTRVTYNLVHEGECLFVDGTAARKPSLGLLSPAKSSQFSVLMYGVVYLSPRPLSDVGVFALVLCSRTVDEAKLLLLPE